MTPDPRDGIDPLLRELFRRIPPPDSEWPMPERLVWFKAMAAALNLVYPADGALIVSLPAPQGLPHDRLETNPGRHSESC